MTTKQSKKTKHHHSKNQKNPNPPKSAVDSSMVKKACILLLIPIVLGIVLLGVFIYDQNIDKDLQQQLTQSGITTVGTVKQSFWLDHKSKSANYTSDYHHSSNANGIRNGNYITNSYYRPSHTNTNSKRYAITTSYINYLDVHYVDTSGTSHVLELKQYTDAQKKVKMNAYDLANFKEGDKITIKFLPNQPEKALLLDEDGNFLNFRGIDKWLFVFLAVFLGMFLYLEVRLLFKYFKLRKQEREA